MSVLQRPVLIVDDSPVIRAVLHDRLLGRGVKEVIMAADAEAAVARFEEHKPGLVLLDITMPEVPGTRVAHHILRSDASTKVVLVTAMSRDKDLVESAIAGGAYAYLRKPVTDADLDALLARIRAEEGKEQKAVHPWGPGTRQDGEQGRSGDSPFPETS